MVSNECESCWHYDYDEEYDDEVYRIMFSRNNHCPYYRQGDEYYLARRQ